MGVLGLSEVKQGVLNIVEGFLRNVTATSGSAAGCCPGWKWENISTTKRPPYVGKLTKDIVYCRLEEGVIERLEQVNPKLEDGRRKVKHHQWLTQQVGHPALDAHFYALRGLMRMNIHWDAFYHSLQLAFPQRREAVQLELTDYAEL